MSKHSDLELRAYIELVGSREYHNQYNRLYRESKINKRHSGLDYINDTAKLKAIKEKYKNGVSDDIIKEMVGIE